MLKMNEVMGWDVNVIDQKVEECRKELRAIAMQKVTTGVEKPHTIKVLKKDIARLLTAKNAKSE